MKNNTSGFTLIEVLIALAILSIALTAVIKATSQNIKDTLYLQNKMVAHWVGLNVINEARLGLIKLSDQSGLEQESEMLGDKWAWQTSTASTPNPHIKKIHVIVFHQPDHKKLASLVSFMYVAT